MHRAKKYIFLSGPTVKEFDRYLMRRYDARMITVRERESVENECNFV